MSFKTCNPASFFTIHHVALPVAQRSPEAQKKMKAMKN